MKRIIVRSLLVLLALVLCAGLYVYFYFVRPTVVDVPSLSSEIKSTQDPVTRIFPEVDGGPNTKVILQSWQGEAGVEVRLYTLEGSGHVIPTRKVKFGRMAGGSVGDIEAADEIWAFFALHQTTAAQ